MLSLQQCREILGGNCGLDDPALEQLRDQIYGLADVITDRIIDRGSPENFNAALRSLAPDEREEVEERAAIIEFEAGAKPDEAERKAILIAIAKRYEPK